MKRKRFEKLERNREKVYEILNFLFKVSRYLETYYRWDDILIIDLDINKKLAICDFWKNIEVGFENMKLYLQSKKLPNTVEYKPGLDMIINDLRIARVYIDTSEFTPNSWQQKDYAAIWSQIIIYGVDDEVMILDDDAPPPRESIMDLKLKRPFCTLGCYDMTLYEFTTSKLTAENPWHFQMRFQTVNDGLKRGVIPQHFIFGMVHDVDEIFIEQPDVYGMDYSAEPDGTIPRRKVAMMVHSKGCNPVSFLKTKSGKCLR
jgi:hypothetical protein